MTTYKGITKDIWFLEGNMFWFLNFACLDLEPCFQHFHVFLMHLREGFKN